MYAGLTISDKPALLKAKKNGYNHTVLRNALSVNIDEALAQIAEMESNEKALLSEKAIKKGCAEMESAEKPMTNLDFLSKNLTKLAEMLVVEIETGDPFAAYSCVKVEFGYHDGSFSKIGWTTCEATAIEKELKFLASPYTEGEKK